ncbi:MAG: DUF3015 family protein [Porticoccaceae bacterium]
MRKLHGKKIIGIIALSTLPSLAFAGAAGGPNCGWGNMLFEGQSGTATHVLAITTNGTTGNNTFGITSGTNGCTSNGTLSYSGTSLAALMMDEFSEDIARGHGEALNAVALGMGIAPEDRAAFAELTHNNFSTLFPHENITAHEVMASINALMKEDSQLAKYSV